MLEHEMHLPAEFDSGANLGRHLVHPVLIQDGMHGIEAQSVEAVLHQPKEDVVSEKTANIGSPEVNCGSPWGATILTKKLRCVERQVITIGAEMIVYNVEEDHQPKVVRPIDQRLQVIGCSVGGIRRIRQYAVISPVALAGKIIDWHQLDGGDAKVNQPWQFPCHT